MLMIVKIRVFELYYGRYGNLSALAQAMGISVSQIYRVRQGKRNINQKFIIGAIKAFPQHRFDDLFYFASGVTSVKKAPRGTAAPSTSRRSRSKRQPAAAVGPQSTSGEVRQRRRKAKAAVR